MDIHINQTAEVLKPIENLYKPMEAVEVRDPQSSMASYATRNSMMVSLFFYFKIKIL